MNDGPNTQSLLGSEWLLEKLAGDSVIEGTTAKIGFPEAGKVAGNGSCNRFSGKVEIGDGTIAVGPLASTRMACPPAVSDQETKFLRALEGATRLAADGPDLLIYSKDLDQPLRFSRLP